MSKGLVVSQDKLTILRLRLIATMHKTCNAVSFLPCLCHSAADFFNDTA